MSDVRWRINALISQIEQADHELGLRECQLSTWRNEGVEFEGDAAECFEIIDRIERRMNSQKPCVPVAEMED